MTQSKMSHRRWVVTVRRLALPAIPRTDMSAPSTVGPPRTGQPSTSVASADLRPDQQMLPPPQAGPELANIESTRSGWDRSRRTNCRPTLSRPPLAIGEAAGVSSFFRVCRRFRAPGTSAACHHRRIGVYWPQLAWSATGVPCRGGVRTAPMLAAMTSAIASPSRAVSCWCKTT